MVREYSERKFYEREEEKDRQILVSNLDNFKRYISLEDSFGNGQIVVSVLYRSDLEPRGDYGNKKVAFAISATKFESPFKDREVWGEWNEQRDGRKMSIRDFIETLEVLNNARVRVELSDKLTSEAGLD